MILKNQNTLGKSCEFEGKGLHTGRYAHLSINPAGPGYGIKFRRTDLGEDVIIEALAENVSNTARSTTISSGEVSVVTIEHLLSALTGLGIDNARIDIDNVEVPILDGSAKPFVEGILAAGIVEQDAPRKWMEISRPVEIVDEKSGSRILVEPADEPSFGVEVDFNSRVLGVQHASWDSGVDYAKELGLCRTFVFFHEIEFLFNNNLVKGGDVDNAIVIVEHPVSGDQLDRIAHLFNVGKVEVNENGYLNNLKLHFDNECARHKLLDLIGDFRLVGGFLKAKVTAYKSGHSINTRAARAVRSAIAEQ